MNAIQWSLIGLFVALLVVLIIFRHKPWAQKAWKYLLISAPVFILGIILAGQKKPEPPKPEPPKPEPPKQDPAPATNVITPVTPKIIVVGLDYQLSTHFTYAMLTKTEHRDLLDKNRDQGKKYLTNMSNLCNNVLELVWTLMGPITISSCFRCLDLNTAIGGAENSQHMVAEASDTEYAGITLQEAFNKIAFSKIPYSQVIFEFGQWIHIGLVDEVLYPGKIGQKLIATRELIKEGEHGYDPANPKKTKTVYTSVTKPI